MRDWTNTTEWETLGRWYDSRDKGEKHFHEANLMTMGLGARTRGGLFHLSDLGREILHVLLAARG